MNASMNALSSYCLRTLIVAGKQDAATYFHSGSKKMFIWSLVDDWKNQLAHKFLFCAMLNDNFETFWKS